MELFKLKFTLRREFVELKDLFLIFNNMVLNDKISSTDIEVRNYTENSNQNNYLYLGLHRCKKNFASIEINRDIESISEETSTNLDKFSDLKESYPFFSVAKDNKTITITISDTNELKEIEVSTTDDIFGTHTECLLSLDFYLRKPFDELTSLVSIANRMLKKRASSFITLQPTSDNKKTYLNINILYQDIRRPSLSITVGLIVNSVPNTYQFELAKYNFACSQLTHVSPVFISCNDTSDSQHGPIIKISVFKPTDSDDTDEIEKQFKLLDSISPIWDTLMSLTKKSYLSFLKITKKTETL